MNLEEYIRRIKLSDLKIKLRKYLKYREKADPKKISVYLTQIEELKSNRRETND